MTLLPRRRLLAGTPLVLATLLLAALVTPPGGPSAPALGSTVAVTDAPDPAHPYSDPVWSPFRAPERNNCVYDNCAGPYHGYWAIDFVGTQGDPVHAAGAGVAHVGRTGATCKTSGRTDGGNWVWVDHGGTTVTKYEHLRTVAVTEGQLVTPRTLLGTMGNTGNECKTTSFAYTHLEYRTGGLTGERRPPPSMRACTADGPVLMPDVAGYASWNDLPKAVYTTPAATSDCLPATWSATPARPAVTGRSGSRSATFRWAAPPAGADRVLVQLEGWHPSLGRYLLHATRSLAATTTATRFTGLVDGHVYRGRVATHGAAGWSAWSGYAKVVPASVPEVPAYRGLTAWRTGVSHAWYRSAPNGSPVTRYVAGQRCYVDGAYRPWRYTSVDNGDIHLVYRNLSPGRYCRYRVRAVNAVGTSAWSVVRGIRTLR